MYHDFKFELSAYRCFAFKTYSVIVCTKCNHMLFTYIEIIPVCRPVPSGVVCDCSMMHLFADVQASSDFPSGITQAQYVFIKNL